MTENDSLEQREERISFQIFGVSATMVGVCFTVLGLFNIFYAIKKVQTLVDELITIDAAFFLITCFVSYMAIRTKNRTRRFKLEKTADIIFLMALTFIVVIAALLIFELI
ncbi:MAG: hypothetical protein QMD94_04705 [Candidatus Omnitrophota bacterium]|nr:hypothetical protein [Candidatus Omnitrophota bacterium]